MYMHVLWRYMCIWDIRYKVTCLHICILLGNGGIFESCGQLCVLSLCVYSGAMAIWGNISWRCVLVVFSWGLVCI